MLSDFSAAEEEILFPALDAGAALLQQTFVREPETLLNEWKKKKIVSGEEQK